MSSYRPTVLAAFRPDAVDHQIDRMLDEAVRGLDMSGQSWAPACNVWDGEQGFYVQLALPGWEANQIVLEGNNQMLTVKGERKAEGGDTGRYHVREIGGTRFARLFKLPPFVDHEKASATHKNGLLTISFPKREEAKCRRIQIEGQ